MCHGCNATVPCQELPDELKSHRNVIALMEKRCAWHWGGGLMLCGNHLPFSLKASHRVEMEEIQEACDGEFHVPGSQAAEILS